MAHSVAGVTAVLTEAQLTVTLKEERRENVHIEEVTCSAIKISVQ